MAGPIDDIIAKVQHGGRIERDEALLLSRADLHVLGRLADHVRRRLHGSSACYCVNRHIHYSDLCTLRCGVCSFSRQAGQQGAYELTIAQVAQQAAQAASAGATELHITGGLHPSWALEHYVGMLQAVRAAAPKLHIKAFTAVELDHIAGLSRTSVQAVLDALIRAGLGSLPGGGAEIFDSAVRAAMFPGKPSAQRWLEIHRLAHLRGLSTNATMLYGHGESDEQRVDHLLALRQLQGQTHGFQSFVPLAFVPPRGWPLPPRAAMEDLRVTALSRLLLDNVPHIKTFWVMHTLRLSQVALHFGADDVHGTVAAYDIVPPQAGQATAVTVEQLRRLIRQAGLEPVERDSQYQPVRKPI